MSATDDTAPGILLLHGKAGSGKSTVSRTVAAMAQDKGYLLSPFFCKRDDPYLSSPRKVLPALAYRFAQQHDSYRIALMEFLRDGSKSAGISHTVDVSTQYTRLFEAMVPSVIDPCRPHLVSVDAIDELNSAERRELVKCLLSLSKLAPWVKIFVTSRDDEDIRNVLLNDEGVHSIDINTALNIDDDIRRYIRAQPVVHRLKLTDDEIDVLTRRAQGLFIWCTTLLAFVRDDKGLIPDEILRSRLLDESDHAALSPLFSLYDQIVAACNEGVEADILPFIHALLVVVHLTSTNRPLSTMALFELLCGLPHFRGGNVQQIDNAIKALHPVLYIDGSTAAVRAHHASFYDYVDARMSQQNDWPTEFLIQQHIAHRCLFIMNSDLMFNICRIEKPVLNKDIPDLPERIRNHVPEILQYSSLFWSKHLSEAMATDTILENNVSQLLSTKKVLFWVELLSLQNALADGAIALERAGQLFAVS